MGGLLATRAVMMSWAWIAARGHIWVHGLAVAAGYVLMSLDPMTTEGQEDKATQSRSCPSLAVKLGRTGPAPHHSTPESMGSAIHLGSKTELTLLAGVQASWP